MPWTREGGAVGCACVYVYVRESFASCYGPRAVDSAGILRPATLAERRAAVAREAILFYFIGTEPEELCSGRGGRIAFDRANSSIGSWWEEGGRGGQAGGGGKGELRDILRKVSEEKGSVSGLEVRTWSVGLALLPASGTRSGNLFSPGKLSSFG